MVRKVCPTHFCQKYIFRYYPRPMGEATLGSLMKNAAEQAGISSRLTNHSIRKSTVTTLSKAGVPPQKIMKITGHKNIQSITHYDAELSIGEHRQISNILQSGQNLAAPSRTAQSSQQIAPSATVSVPSNMDIEPLRAIENVPSTSSAPDFSAPSRFPATFLSGNTFNGCTFHFGNFGALPNQSEN